MSIMDTFAGIRDAAAFLIIRNIGAKCGLTGGGRRNQTVKIAFHRYGLRTTVEGETGNRVITLVAPYDANLARRRKLIQDEYFSQGNGSNPRPFLDHGLGLAVGGSVVCTDDDGKAVRRLATKHYGPWTTTVHKVDGGWELKRLSEERNPALVKRSAGQGW